MKRKGLAFLLALSLIGANTMAICAMSLDETPTQNVDIQDSTDDVTETDLDQNNLSENNEDLVETPTVEDTDGVEAMDTVEDTQENILVPNQDEIENTPLESNIGLDEDNVNNLEPTSDEDSITAPTIEEPIEDLGEEPAEEIPNYVGMKETELDTDFINNANTIITYVVREDVEEGTVLSQTTNEDGNIVLEIATAPVVVEPVMSFNLLNNFELMDEMTDPPSVENNTWSDYPMSYEYNWDNSQSCWNWGEWKNGVKYTTPEGTYDNNVRHEMGMYSDGENIHLRISYATIYNTIANGDDMNFYIDGQGAKFRVLYADNGSGITGQARPEGSYDLVVVNGDHWNSSYDANGSYGTMIVKEGNVNNEMEIVIPLETLKEQNSNIDIEHIQNIEFFNPNLMYRHISCGGASTGSMGFIIMTILLFGIATIIYQKRGYFDTAQLNYSVG